jgi:hypothetical protein
VAVAVRARGEGLPQGQPASGWLRENYQAMTSFGTNCHGW